MAQILHYILPAVRLFFQCSDWLLNTMIDVIGYSETGVRTRGLFFWPIYVLVQSCRITISCTCFLLAGRTVDSGDLKRAMQSLQGILQELFSAIKNQNTSLSVPKPPTFNKVPADDAETGEEATSTTSNTSNADSEQLSDENCLPEADKTREVGVSGSEEEKNESSEVEDRKVVEGLEDRKLEEGLEDRKVGEGNVQEGLEDQEGDKKENQVGVDVQNEEVEQGTHGDNTGDEVREGGEKL